MRGCGAVNKNFDSSKIFGNCGNNQTYYFVQSRDMDKMVRGQKVTQNTVDKMGRRLPDALAD